MIHFTKMGQRMKIGLNLYRAPGGFVAHWLWYDTGMYEVHGWRFRLRMHMAPRILWSIERANVIDGYLLTFGLSLVSHEVLNDLNAVEQSQKSANESLVYVKPQEAA